MNSEQLTSTINTLCPTGGFATLYRVLKDIPGSFSILTSDRTAEQKRQELLKLIKEQR